MISPRPGILSLHLLPSPVFRAKRIFFQGIPFLKAREIKNGKMGIEMKLFSIILLSDPNMKSVFSQNNISRGVPQTMVILSPVSLL